MSKSPSSLTLRSMRERVRALPLAGRWPFQDPGRKASPEIRRAALNVLRTTARDWGLAASR